MSWYRRGTNLTGSLQPHSKRDGLTGFAWCQKEMQVPAVEPEDEFALRLAQESALSAPPTRTFNGQLNGNIVL